MDYIKEEWRKAVPGRTDYEVSSTGKIRKVYKHGYRFIKGTRKDKNKINSYLKISISGKKVSIHRIVAEAFCDGKTEQRCFVNHKNGIKNDNRAYNLEWCTAHENNEHARLVLKMSNHIEVCVFNENGDVIDSLISISDAKKKGYKSNRIMSKEEYSKEKALMVINKKRKKPVRVKPYHKNSFIKKLDMEIINKVKILYEGGLNNAEIAREIGLSWYKVSMILKIV